MKLDESVRNLAEVRQQINDFTHKCEEDEYTDTGEALDLLDRCFWGMTDVLNAWDNTK